MVASHSFKQVKFHVRQRIGEAHFGAYEEKEKKKFIATATHHGLLNRQLLYHANYIILELFRISILFLLSYVATL